MQESGMRVDNAVGEASARLAQRANRVFPHGITRNTVDRNPHLYYVSRGQGAYITDADGRRLLDLNNNFTTLIHGHGFEPILEAVTRVMRDGTCFSNPTIHEIDLAELLCDRIPAVDKIRFVNTGSEAVMFAIKAARAATGRPAIAKIEGAYHGAYDWAEVGQAGTPQTWGSPEEPVAVPSYQGQPPSISDDVIMLRFNDTDEAVRRIKAHAGRLACILIDPMPSRAGLMPPDPRFIEAITNIARAHGILIVVDEVLNLRQSYHGASARFGLDPDLIAMGKIIGGGFPIGAVGGKNAVMEVFGTADRPARLSQGGTFSANPISMVAGLASMKAMTPDQFARLEILGNRMRGDLQRSIDRHDAPFSVTGSASLFRLHPKPNVPREFRDTHLTPGETDIMNRLDLFMKANGVLMPKGAAACLSTAMTEEDIDLITDIFDRFLDRPEA